MSPADLDDLYGDGAEFGRDVVVKAELRFRVRPPRHLAARDVVDRVVSAYDERLDMIVDEVIGVLRHAGRDPAREPVVLAVVQPDAVAKAAPRAPFRPGSRGGKWYRDSKGNVRYGDPPEGRYMGSAPDKSPMVHVDHLRPRPFMGAAGNDRELAGFLVEHGREHGFTDGELRFLGVWYGAGDEGGALFDAFLECAGLTRDDLKVGVANFKFGGKKLTYEEAVFEFFAAQGALFMGEDPTSADDLEEWHRVLNDEIKPLLDGVFAKYEGSKDDETLQAQFASEPERQRRRFFDAARRTRDLVDGVADAVVGDWSPSRQVDVVLAGLQGLGLVTRRARAARAAYVHGRPHLRDAVTLDERLLGDGLGRNPLVGAADEFAGLSASHLMLLHVAAELHRRWDPHARSFSTEKQAEVGAGELGEAALAALSGKTARWAEAAGAVRDRLAGLVDLLVAKLNAVNSQEGTPEKHGPAAGPRTAR